MNAKVIALVNQKGRCGKIYKLRKSRHRTGPSREKCCWWTAPQASLTISLGHPQPDNLPVTLSDVMGKVLTNQLITPY